MVYGLGSLGLIESQHLSPVSTVSRVPGTVYTIHVRMPEKYILFKCISEKKGASLQRTVHNMNRGAE